MKRNLLFAAALMAGVAVSAQELGEMDFSVISSETAVTVSAGTLVAASENLSVFTKFQDDYKTTGVTTASSTVIWPSLPSGHHPREPPLMPHHLARRGLS